MSTSDDGLLRLVVVSGSPAAGEVVGMLDDWRSWGVVEPVWMCAAADVPMLDGQAGSLLARALGDCGSAPVDLLRMAARWGSVRAIKGVFLHDCDVAAGVGDYVQRCAAIRRALQRALPSEVSADTVDTFIELGMVNLFAPVDSTPVFSPDTVAAVGAPGAVLAMEDRTSPSAMAAPIRRADNYPAHVAAAVATLCGAWRGLPLEDAREIFLRSLDHENGYQVRAMRQMIRIAGVDPSVGDVADAVAVAMRGGERPDLVNTGTVSRGALMDRRLVDEAVAAVRHLDGDPVAFRNPPAVQKRVTVHGAAELRRHKWAFTVGQTRETFRVALLAVKNWLRRVEHDVMVGDNPHRRLAHHDLPAQRMQQFTRELADYTSRMDGLERGLRYEGMPGELMSALRIHSFKLVDGGLGEVSDVRAQPVLSDRDKAVPRPSTRLHLDVDVADALREPDSEPAFMDMWRLGGLLHLIARYTNVNEPVTVADPADATEMSDYLENDPPATGAASEDVRADARLDDPDAEADDPDSGVEQADDPDSGVVTVDDSESSDDGESEDEEVSK